MKSRESALFTATALPAGAGALALTGWLAYGSRAALGERLPELAALILFSILSYALSYSPSGRDRVSLELAYFLAAALVLPFPGALVVGATSALAGSLLRGVRRLAPLRCAAVAGANATLATAITAAASGTALFFSSPRGILPALTGAAAAGDGAREILGRTLLTGCALFLAMNLVNLVLAAAWMAARGEPARDYARHFLLRIFPFETITVPFGCLLAFLLAGETGLSGFVLLASVGLYQSFLLRNLGRSEERLRHANAELEDRVAELAMLNAIGREISSSLDPRRVFETVRRECRMVFQPDFFWIARLDRETREVRLAYSMAGESPARALTFPLGRGIASRVIETEQPLLVADTVQDPRLREIDPIVVEPKIRSILAVPLFVEKKVVGVLSVQSFRANAYGERQIELLATIAQQAAIALENARHHQLATVDQLTGLYQRDYFTQRLGEEYHRSSRYGTPFSVLMLDLDWFKKINDRFGHMAGDRFLREIGTLVRSSLRGADIPCRFGGEEFCALLPETDLAGARAIAERLRGEIGALQLREGAHYLGTTVSIGIACYPLHFEGSVSGLLQKADEALYRAKREGRDRVIVADA